MSETKTDLRSITQIGQMFNPTVMGNIDSDARIIYELMARKIPKTRGGGIDVTRIEYHYPHSDDLGAIHSVSWQEWESWVTSTQAVPIDYLMIYQWDDYKTETHIVTVAPNPWVACEQVMKRYKAIYGVKSPHDLGFVEKVFPITAATFLSYAS